MDLAHRLKSAGRHLPYLRALLNLVWQAAPRKVVFAALAIMLFSSLLAPLSLYLLKLTVDQIQGAIARGGPVHSAALLLGLTALVAVLEQLLSALLGLLRTRQTLVTVDRVNGLLQEKSVQLDLGFFESSAYYDKLHRAQSESGYRLGKLLDGMVELLVNLATLAAVTALIVSTEWLVAVVLVLAAFPNVLVGLRHSTILYDWMKKRTALNRRAGYLHALLTMDCYAKEVRVFGLGELFRERHRVLREVLRGERLAVESRRVWAQCGANSVAVAAGYLAFGILAFSATRGTATIGDLFLYFQALRRMQGNLTSVMSTTSDFYENLLFLRNLFEFLELTPTVQDPPNALPVPAPMRQGIRFHDVCFSYPGSDAALRNINLRILPRQVVALVGANGAGKSTLVKLLCRLHDPDRGSITVDGTDLRLFATRELRRQFSFVFQDYVQYQCTARDNVWYGEIRQEADDATVARAAAKAGAYDFLMRLPNGLDTTLGTWFEDGRQLSQGQWQKVALARALMRDSQVIVLDEPTSSLDVEAEEAFYQGFRSNLGERSAVLVSHRFSSVRLADYIYVLEGGAICEEGTHEELVARGGIYTSLFRAHARQYAREES